MLKGSWQLEDLSQKIQVPASVVRKKIAYWQAQGLIEETSSDNFSLIENIEQHARPDSGICCVENYAIFICSNSFAIDHTLIKHFSVFRTSRR